MTINTRCPRCGTVRTGVVLTARDATGAFLLPICAQSVPSPTGAVCCCTVVERIS